jgi:hypothetical protein
MISKMEKIDFSEKNICLASVFGDFHSETTPTSMEREAIYLIEHSIHHFALIRIGLQTNFQKVRIESNFGIAFSTLNFREEKKQQKTRVNF